MMSRRKLLKYGLISAGAGVAAAPLVLMRRQRQAKKNIVLIVCDALRADRIGLKSSFSGGRSLTPTLDHIAASGVSFANAKAPSTFTPISMLSVMYDAGPTHVSYGKENKASSNRASLPSRLAAKGYYALFVSANAVLDFEEVTGGFHKYDILEFTDLSMRMRYQSKSGALARELYADSVNSRLGVTLDRSKDEAGDRPIYIQLHYMDTHEPYNNTGLDMGVRHDNFICCHNVRKAVTSGDERFGDHGLTTAQALKYLTWYYDSAVRALDSGIATLLERLRSRGILDDALVIVTADHGEEFADNSETEQKHVGHVGPLSREQIHVPLLALTTGRFGSLTGGTRVNRQVSTTRVVNDLIDDYISDPGGRYSEIQTALAASTFPSHRVLSAINWPHSNTVEVALIDDNLKLRKSFIDGKYSAFHYVDGWNLRPVPITKEMTETLDKAFENCSPTRPTITEEAKQRLRALGYLQ